MTIMALFGSGEFQPWARRVDRWCLERAAADGDRVLILPTASAPEGPETFERWARMGIEHYRALGLSPELLDVRTREDAERADLADRVAGARLIYFSGGNPGYLCRTLSGTRVWQSIVAAVGNGTAFGGCSAGACFVGSLAPLMNGDSIEEWVSGLGVLPRAFIVPHFDALDDYGPNLRADILASAPPASLVVGIDEETAMCGDGDAWTVLGKGAVWVSEPTGDGLTPYREGDRFSAPLGARLEPA